MEIKTKKEDIIKTCTLLLTDKFKLDPAAERELLESAVAYDHLPAFDALGEALENGKYGTIDNERAKGLYLRGSDLGDEYSTFNLGRIYQKLLDIEMAIKYYSLAIVKKNFDSILSLADIYIEQKKLCSAITRIKQGFTFKHPSELDRLLDFLSDKTSFEAMSSECIECNTRMHQHCVIDLLRSSSTLFADCNHPELLNNIGFLFDPTVGEYLKSLKNLDEAIKFYRKSNALGGKGAKVNLYFALCIQDQKSNVKECSTIFKELVKRDYEEIKDRKFNFFMNPAGSRVVSLEQQIACMSWCLGLAEQGDTWAMETYGMLCLQANAAADGISWLHRVVLDKDREEARQALVRLSSHYSPIFDFLSSPSPANESVELLFYYFNAQERLASLYFQGRVGVGPLIEHGFNWRKYYRDNPQNFNAKSTNSIKIVQQERMLYKLYLEISINLTHVLKDIRTVALFYLPWFAAVEGVFMEWDADIKL